VLFGTPYKTFPVLRTGKVARGKKKKNNFFEKTSRLVTQRQRSQSKQLAAIDFGGGTCGLIRSNAQNLTTFFFIFLKA
jgi:hypothetical protein